MRKILLFGMLCCMALPTSAQMKVQGVPRSDVKRLPVAPVAPNADTFTMATLRTGVARVKKWLKLFSKITLDCIVLLKMVRPVEALLPVRVGTWTVKAL